MENETNFDFGDTSIAEAYDKILVPLLFDPWTERLITENGPWSSRYVLDLACGTGAVTKQLLNEVTCKGKVFALDLNEEMLSINKGKFEELGCDDAIEFLHASADEIPIEDNLLDIVLCQQGFQFFPEKLKSAQEIYRVLNRSGRVIISTWLPVSACEMIGVLCESLIEVNERDLADLMRIPFDYMPQGELRGYFEKAGFKDVEIERQSIDLILKGGIEEAITFIYSTPIGPQLNALPNAIQREFKEIFKAKVNPINGTNFGKMETFVLKAMKH